MKEKINLTDYQRRKYNLLVHKGRKREEALMLAGHKKQVHEPTRVAGREDQPLKGLKIFILGNYYLYGENLARYYEGAFKDLGAFVRGYCDSTDKRWGPSFRPDIILYLKGIRVRSNLISEIRNMWKVKRAIFYWPDPLEDITARYGVEPFSGNNEDYVKAIVGRHDFTDHFIACYYPKSKLDELGVKWLPVAYDPNVHFAMSYPVEKEANFVGTFKHGREFIASLDPQPDIFGNEWDKPCRECGKWPRIETTDVYDGGKRFAVCRSKVMLNQHYLGRGPNHRFFEALAMNRALLTDCPPEVMEGVKLLGFRPDKDFAVYDTPERCQRKLHKLLKWDDLREGLASSGYEAVQKHTYQSRALEMMREIGYL